VKHQRTTSHIPQAQTNVFDLNRSGVSVHLRTIRCRIPRIATKPRRVEMTTNLAFVVAGCSHMNVDSTFAAKVTFDVKLQFDHACFNRQRHLPAFKSTAVGCSRVRLHLSNLGRFSTSAAIGTHDETHRAHFGGWASWACDRLEHAIACGLTTFLPVRTLTLPGRSFTLMFFFGVIPALDLRSCTFITQFLALNTIGYTVSSRAAEWLCRTFAIS
jgi:hypothetical protein